MLINFSLLSAIRNYFGYLNLMSFLPLTVVEIDVPLLKLSASLFTLYLQSGDPLFFLGPVYSINNFAVVEIESSITVEASVKIN